MTVTTTNSVDAGSLFRGAAFITADADRGSALVFTRRVDLTGSPGDVRLARLYAAAPGVYEGTVNGAPATESLLNPGWSAYEWRLHYQEFDVTAQVQAGPS